MEAPDLETYWTDLNQKLFVPPRNVRRPDLTGLMYRGLPNEAYVLTTSLQRLKVKVRRGEGRRPVVTDYDWREELQYRERRLIDSFRKYARGLLLFGTSDWDVMVLGQHHRLPTRLLDWTASPLVALFFATEPLTQDPSNEPDGMIWCVSHPATLDLLDPSFRAALDSARKGTADAEFMNAFVRVEDFDGASSREPSLLWFEPHSIDQRIVNQFAVFSLMQGVTSRVDDYIHKHPDIGWSVSVRGDMKALLRRRLYLLNVTERTLFPGLEGTARWQRDYYSDD